METVDRIEQNKKVYDSIAPFFASTRAFLWSDMAPFADDLLPDSVLLDVGCGNGRVYQIAQEKQVRYIGVDQSIELLRIGAKSAGVSVCESGEMIIPPFPAEPIFVLADMRALPIADHSVDTVWCIAALQHLPNEADRLSALHESHRVLKKGGKLLLMNWNLYSRHAARRHPECAPGDFMIPWKHHSDGHVVGERYYHGFTEEELLRLLEASKFRIEKQYYARRGSVSDKEHGMNIISFAYKK